jgi:hypothetical protein
MEKAKNMNKKYLKVLILRIFLNHFQIFQASGKAR